MDIIERLDSIGYGEFKTENPKYTIKLILERIGTPALKAAIEVRVKVAPGIENMFVCLSRA